MVQVTVGWWCTSQGQSVDEIRLWDGERVGIEAEGGAVVIRRVEPRI
jgi:hypothetical protein